MKQEFQYFFWVLYVFVEITCYCNTTVMGHTSENIKLYKILLIIIDIILQY